jgi:hypothetical protein
MIQRLRFMANGYIQSNSQVWAGGSCISQEIYVV